MSSRLFSAVFGAILVVAALIAADRYGSPQTAVATPGPTVAQPPAASIDTCGHVVVRGLLLTAGCAYEVPLTTPPLSVVTDGSWLSGTQGPSGVDLMGSSGPATNSTLRLRLVRGVLEAPCDLGSTSRIDPPSNARQFLDWLGSYIPEPNAATRVNAVDFPGWTFEFGAEGASFAPDDTCLLVSLVAPPLELSDGLDVDSVLADRRQPTVVGVFDTIGGLLMVVYEPTDIEGSREAGMALFAGISFAR